MSAQVGLNTTKAYAAPGGTTDDGSGFGLGDRVTDNLGKIWVYCLAGTGGVTGAGYVVTIDPTYTALMSTTTVSLRGMPVGVAAVAVTAGQYFWAQTYGVCDNIQVLASCAANVRLNTTATAGSPDDDGTSTTKQIEGLYLTTARGGTAGVAPGTLNFPVIGVTL